jgi:hypothetical protein
MKIMLKLKTQAKYRVKIGHFALSDDRQKYMTAAMGYDASEKQ